MRRRLAALAAVAIAVAATVGVLTAALETGPQSLEARTQAIASTLRCPTCDNLSVADSPSPMARSMRGGIAEQLEAGRTPDEVRQWFVDRYGPWVLLSPPREGISLLVWLAPAAAVAVAGGVGGWLLRGRRSQSTAAKDVDVDQLHAAWQAGELDVPDTPAGERLAAAMGWLDELRRAPSPGGQQRIAAVEEVAAAWQATQRAPREPSGARRPIGWAVGGVVLLAAIAAALPTTIAARGVGGIATGSAPGGSGEILAEQDGPQVGGTDQPAGVVSPDEAAALLARLERVAAAREDPAAAADAVVAELPGDQPANDRLTIGLLALQHDHLAAADALAVSVLAEDASHMEAALLRGLALTARGDPAGARWLERFVDAAPAEHPGRPVAEDALAGEENRP